jgi:AraC family transcriptional regulator
MQVVRRTLFDGELLQAVHAWARPSLQRHGEIDRQSVNVLVLPLAGVFAMHDGPRRHAIATPNHAVFVAADRPYRMSLPAETGDECLTLRFSAAALARLAPEAMSGDGFDLSAFESCVPLAPGILLTRSLLWRRLAGGEWDPLEVEEVGAGLLVAALHAARKDGRAWNRSAHGARSARRLRQVGRVMEAVCAHPDRKWSLDALAALACVSPWHLAHVFREETGASVYGYVLRARLAKALDAVLDTNADLSAIAHETGFASPSHFTARFRALFGMTPVELRRKAGRRAAAEVCKIVTARTPAAA